MIKRRAVRYCLSGFAFLIAAACGQIDARSASADVLQFAGQSAELTLVADGGHEFVLGRVGETDVRLIVDTGSHVNVIDRAIAERMGLEAIRQMEVMSGGSVPIKGDIVIVPELRVGEVTVRGAEFLALELNEMSMGTLQGVLGMPLFNDVLLSIDPALDRISISRTHLSEDDPDAIPLYASEGPIQVDIDVSGQIVRMTLDTGAPGGFTFPAALIDSIPLSGTVKDAPNARLVDGERNVQSGVLDGQIRLGRVTYEKPTVTFFDPSPPHGNIGNAVLRDFVMSIDQSRHLLALRQLESAAVTVAEVDTSDPRSLGLQLRGAPDGGLSTVAHVIPGSLAERAGFQRGDVVHVLNGRPMQDYQMSDLRTLFQSHTPLRFEIERNGERRVIEIE